MKKKEVFNVVFSAIMIALAIAFEYFFKMVLILKMPNGGGISLSMLPLAVAAIVCGFWYGLASGILYGIINCFLIDAYGFNLWSMILDYLVAFSGVAVLGLFRKQILANKKQYFIIGFVIAILIRWVASGFSGVINAAVWGYDSEFLMENFGTSGIKGLYFFSFILYNLPYIFVSGALCIMVGLLSYKALFLNSYINKDYDEEYGNYEEHKTR